MFLKSTDTADRPEYEGFRLRRLFGQLNRCAVKRATSCSSPYLASLMRFAPYELV
ncbi:hypothetical protein NBRC111894_2593 [Sporolactobacillus inulinus]|uniref:Uncharacterized protein n=1 Tax=Sporolactobacillus inulinus TaxID=2078 RepID=A0A4Y1ZDD2_9BACL|nr:hypothetical protein NBRC111894_2593 [Sporolactobacillus inulinus]